MGAGTRAIISVFLFFLFSLLLPSKPRVGSSPTPAFRWATHVGGVVAFWLSSSALVSGRSCHQNPRGSKYPIFEDCGPKCHSRSVFWAQKPQILGTWTLWECQSQDLPLILSGSLLKYLLKAKKRIPNMTIPSTRLICKLIRCRSRFKTTYHDSRES